MSKEESIRIALGSFSWWYKRRMFRNIENGLGINMMNKVIKRAGAIYDWSNYYSRKWEEDNL